MPKDGRFFSHNRNAEHGEWFTKNPVFTNCVFKLKHDSSCAQNLVLARMENDSTISVAGAGKNPPLEIRA